MKLFYLLVFAGLISYYPTCFAQITILDSFNPSEIGGICSIGTDPATGNIWVYGCSNNEIHYYSPDGTFISSIPRPGESADDVDITFVTEDLILNTSSIPAGTLLFINGETSTTEIYAVDKTTGTVIDILNTQFGSSHVVGGSYHPIRTTFFLVQDNVPGTAEENKIAEIDPVTGVVLNSFQTTGIFTVFYGDMEVNTSTGNLFIVSSFEKGRLAEYTPEGELVQIHTLPPELQNQNLSGIAIDCEKEEAWVATTGGIIWHLGNFPCGCPSIRINANHSGAACDDYTLRLFADTIPNANYQWTGPNGFASSQQNPVIIDVNASHGGIYTVEVVFPDCPSILDSTEVIINTVPDDFSTSNNGPSCVGDAIQLFADTVPNADYQWTGPNGFASSQQNPAIPKVSLTNGGKYFVEVTLLGCSPIQDSTEVIINIIPDSFNASTNGPSCVGDAIQLFADTVPNADYQWTGPNGFASSQQNPVISNADSSNIGIYTVEVTLPNCPSAFDSTEVVINSIPDNFSVSDNEPICVGDTLMLFAHTIFNASYQWTGPNGFSSFQQNPIIFSTDEFSTGDYQVIATIDECSITAVTSVVLNECCDVFVPNAFTPNGDSLNDVFEIFASCEPEDFEMKLYNRWGELIYVSNHTNDYWDGKYQGKEVQPGVYTWIMKYKLFNETGEIQELTKRGGVFVNR